MKLKHKFLKVKSEKSRGYHITICEGDDILIYWTLVGMDEEHENSALELLSHIITMFISFRGFGLYIRHGGI